jgi:hypothetical protein
MTEFDFIVAVLAQIQAARVISFLLLDAMNADALLGMAAAVGAQDEDEVVVLRRENKRLHRRVAAERSWRLRNQLAEVRPLFGKARQAQARHHNSEVAGSADWELHEQQRPKSKGTGAWRKRTITEYQRIMFDYPPTQQLRLIALNLRPRASHRTITQVMYMSAVLLRREQGRAIADAMATARFAVVQLLFDEAEFKYITNASFNRRGLDSATLAIVGRLSWVDTDLKERENEIIIEPRTIERNSAACISSAFKSVPEPLGSIWRGGETPDNVELCALTPGMDSHAANKMMVTLVENKAAENVIVLPGFCKQHATANILSPITKKLQILNPTFCLAKRRRNFKFHQRLIAGWREAVQLTLEHIPGSKFPDWRPNPDDQEHARNVLDLCYFDYRPDVAIDQDASDLAAQRRRANGEELLKRCCGDWRRSKIVFWDWDDEFERDGAVEHLCGILMKMVFSSIGDPAENKWNSVYPIVRQLLFETCFHNVLVSALRHACNVVNEDLGDLSELSDGDLIGSLSSQGWKKREARRELKALAFFENPASRFVYGLFLFVARFIMRLHYTFFRHSQQTPFLGDGRISLIFDLCDPARSPAKKIIDEFYSLLDGRGWGMLETAFGLFDTWTPRQKELSTETILLAIGELGRRLVKPFMEDFYKHVVPIVDPRNSEEDRLARARDFFFVDLRLLGDASRKVRRLAGTKERLLEPLLKRFYSEP